MINLMPIRFFKQLLMWPAALYFTKGKSQVSIPSASAQETHLFDLASQIGDAQLEAVLNQLGIQDTLYQGLPGVSDQIFKDISGGGTLDSLVQSGLSPTDEDRALIDQFTNEQISAGESGIDADLQEALQLLRTELAPSRGLRPGDTPIVDRGLGLSKEALRLKSQLGSNVRANAAGKLLDLPFRRQEVLGNLADRAFQNRLNFLSTASNVGLGLSAFGNPASAGSSLANTRMGQATTRTTEKDYGKLIRGVGAAVVNPTSLFGG